MDLTRLQELFSGFTGQSGSIPIQLISLLGRILLPLLCIWLVVRCARSLLRGKVEREVWGRLTLPNGDFGEFRHWENIVGRAKNSDVVLQSPTVSRNHAAFLRDDKGAWQIYSLAKNQLSVNGAEIPYQGHMPVSTGDVVSLGGVQVTFQGVSAAEELEQAKRRTRPGKRISPGGSLFLLTVIQALLWVELMIAYGGESGGVISVTCLLVCVMMWLLHIFYRVFRRTGFELETLAFFLTTLCFAVTANKNPEELLKQAICLAVGLVLFIVLSLILRNLTLSKQLRWPVAVLAAGLLAFNLLFGARLFGAKNWVSIGPISFQPSELVKLAFVLVGATTLERMFSRRNLIFTLLFSAFCVGCLGLMSDFGTALIFFATFLAIAFLRSGDLPSIAFMGSAAVFAGYLIIRFKPYIARRFGIFLHAWSDPSNLGYQQTRTMAALANGGLFGHGLGNGWLKNIAAANTDLVFGVLGDELGLIVALCAVAVIVIFAVFAVKAAVSARSTFYVIAACSTAMLLVVQTMLNVLGSVDLLPLTGVTFPFVSMGGSSMICCWGLLAYLKCADTRQNAALSIRLPSRKAARAALEQARQRREAGARDQVSSDPGRRSAAQTRTRTQVRPDPRQTRREPGLEDYLRDAFREEGDGDGWDDYLSGDTQGEDSFDQGRWRERLGSSDGPEGASDADDWQRYFDWEEDDRK